MRHRVLIPVVATVALLQTGCGIALRDAASAGVFDFVSGGITAILNALLLAPLGVE